MSMFDVERQHVGNGWQDIIERLHADLNLLIPGYDVRQIKEKFGCLRYYITVPPNITEDDFHAAYDRIRIAEGESLRTCEVCGAPGTTRGTWYLQTLCEKHETEREARHRGERQRQ